MNLYFLNAVIDMLCLYFSNSGISTSDWLGSAYVHAAYSQYHCHLADHFLRWCCVEACHQVLLIDLIRVQLASDMSLFVYLQKRVINSSL